ncbi:hypothetical protein [Sphaerisporangium rufum]|nr:hypothetical protein [Sphaerisporangium rufum]
MESTTVREAPAGAGLAAERAKLARLRESLAALGVTAEFREAMPALLVPRPDVGLPLWVFVGYGGAYYSWQSAEKRHPVADPAGAARVLAGYIAGRTY